LDTIKTWRENLGSSIGKEEKRSCLEEGCEKGHSNKKKEAVCLPEERGLDFTSVKEARREGKASRNM